MLGLTNTVQSLYCLDGKPEVEKEETWLKMIVAPSALLELGLTSGPIADWKELPILSVCIYRSLSGFAYKRSLILSVITLDFNLTCLLLLFSQVSMVRPYYFKLGFSGPTKHFFSFYSYPIRGSQSQSS